MAVEGASERETLTTRDKEVMGGIGLVLVIVLFAVCSGGENPAVPDVRGQALDNAKLKLSEAGFDDPEVKDDGFFGVVDEANWRVCAQTPVGQATNEKVSLTVKRECAPAASPSEEAVASSSRGDTTKAAAPKKPKRRTVALIARKSWCRHEPALGRVYVHLEFQNKARNPQRIMRNVMREFSDGNVDGYIDHGEIRLKPGTDYDNGWLPADSEYPLTGCKVSYEDGKGVPERAIPVRN